MTIKFGTDGWRGRIAEDFNFENLEIVSQAIAEYLKGGKIIATVGYDNRFMSENYARFVGKVLMANGIKPILSHQAIPTPVLSYATVKKKAGLGIMITASHNPFYFNGLKIKMPSGCSAPVPVTREIEKTAQRIMNGQKSPHPPFLKVGNKEDFVQEYYAHLRRYLKKIDYRSLTKKIVIDPLFGSGANFIENFFGNKKKLKILSIHSYRDPYFGGINPEPIEENLSDLRKAVLREKAVIGIAFDGDADRIGLVAEQGEFINSHQIFSLLLLHFIRNYKISGPIAKTISGSFLIDRIAKKYRLSIIETPIGFKYIAELLEKREIFIGGEESGGIGLPGHIPERDGILSGLLILERMSWEKKTLRQLIKELHQEFGSSFYGRIDLTMKAIPDKKSFTEKIIKLVKGKNIFSDFKEIKDYDGIKFIYADDSWLLLRPSGTEPVIRIYAENESKQKMQKILALGKNLIYTVLKE